MYFAPLLAISTLMLPDALAQGSSKATIFSDTASDLATGYDAGQQALAAVNVIVELFKNENANDTMVRIGVNEAHSNKWDYEGSVGIVWAFDGFNSVLGSSDIKPDGRIEAGGEGEFEVHQFLGDKRTAQYLDVIASDDEICISYIQASTFDSGRAPFTWLGDIGRACGQSWEYGSKPITGGDKALYFPSCVWLDQDHGDDIDKKVQTDTITNRQMKIDLWAYAGLGAENGTILSQADIDPIAERTPRGPYFDEQGKSHPDSGRARRRSSGQDQQQHKARPQSAKMAERLWVNSRFSQSAKELCNSPTSRGSDFVSVNEGLFCDMETKKLHPLCSKDKDVGCFDLHADKLQLHRRGGAKLGQKEKSVKQYKTISYSD